MEERVLAYRLLRIIKDVIIGVKERFDIFNDMENSVIDNLLLDGSIIKYYDRTLGKDIYILTNKGSHLLFVHENEKRIKDFELLLEEKGYNTEYLPDFIKTRDLNDDINNILSVIDYEMFTINTLRILHNKNRKLIIK